MVIILESLLLKPYLQTRQQFQSGNDSFTLAIAFIALLVGAVGIITTLYTSVSERTKEIGTMKAIGAKSKFILMLFMSEALLIGILGSSLGILTGISGSLRIYFWLWSNTREEEEEPPGAAASSYHSRYLFQMTFCLFGVFQYF